MQAGQREKLEVGKYFENVDPYKAVMLYHKAGNYQRALCLAFRFVSFPQIFCQSIISLAFRINPSESTSPISVLLKI